MSDSRPPSAAPTDLEARAEYVSGAVAIAVGVVSSLVLAVFAALMEFIPTLGQILAAIPAVILGLFDSVGAAVAIGLMYGAVQMLENQIFVPRIIGVAVSLHPAVLIVALVAMSQFGLLGVVLAAPLIAVIRDLFRYAYGRFQDPPRPAGVLPELAGAAGTRERARSKRAARAVLDRPVQR